MVRHFTDGNYCVYRWVGFNCYLIGTTGNLADAKRILWDDVAWSFNPHIHNVAHSLKLLSTIERGVAVA